MNDKCKIAKKAFHKAVYSRLEIYFEDAVHCTISDLLTASFSAPFEHILVKLATDCSSRYSLAKACSC